MSGKTVVRPCRVGQLVDSITCEIYKCNGMAYARVSTSDGIFYFCREHSDGSALHGFMIEVL